MAKTMQSVLNKAKKLGFEVSEKREGYVSDYDLILNQDTFEEHERWKTFKVTWWRVTYPSDCHFPPEDVYNPESVERMIMEYENRHESAKRDAEFSKNTIQAMEIMKQRFTKQ